jgi:hypothetical protein
LFTQFSSSKNFILQKELLAARKQAKKDMKNAGTEFEKSVQNGRQVSSNILELKAKLCSSFFYHVLKFLFHFHP